MMLRAAKVDEQGSCVTGYRRAVFEIVLTRFLRHSLASLDKRVTIIINIETLQYRGVVRDSKAGKR